MSRLRVMFDLDSEVVGSPDGLFAALHTRKGRHELYRDPVEFLGRHGIQIETCEDASLAPDGSLSEDARTTLDYLFAGKNGNGGPEFAGTCVFRAVLGFVRGLRDET